MKRIGITLLSVVFLSSFVACKKGGEGTNGGSDSTKVDTSAAATPPEPEKPDYQKKAESLPKTTATFETDKFDFKKVKEGAVVKHTFKFTNTGDNDLEITHVKPSCGCTTPNWPKEAVKKGQTGSIDVEFNSAGKSGMQNKTITVFGNFEGGIQKTLSLTGEVEGKPADKTEAAKPADDGHKH